MAGLEGGSVAHHCQHLYTSLAFSSSSTNSWRGRQQDLSFAILPPPLLATRSCMTILSCKGGWESKYFPFSASEVEATRNEGPKMGIVFESQSPVPAALSVSQ